jgi:plastocyanin
MRLAKATTIVLSACLLLGLSLAWAGLQASPAQEAARPVGPAEQKPRTRPHGQSVLVDPASIAIDDGDTVFIRWAKGDNETVSHYGDNGLPELAAQVTTAARSVDPLPFESPHVFRKRMRSLSDWQKAAKREPAH